MKSKTFYKQSKIANKKRTKTEIQCRRNIYMDWLFKTPMKLVRDGVTKNGKEFVTFYY